jgi:hypothetical protein
MLLKNNIRLYKIIYMKRQLFLIIKRVIFVCLLFSVTTVFSQQITPKILPLKKPKIVNFKALAAYQLSHPQKHKKRFIEQGEDREHGSMFKPHYIPSNAPVFNKPINSPERASSENSPTPRIVFNGIISNESDFPPDINAAVGNTYILETTNQEYDIFTRSGAYVSAIDIPTFFAAQNGTYYYDPHVEYDVAHKRYIIVSDGFQNINNTEGPSEIFLAVSQTDDPTGNWYTYSFNGWAVDSSTDFLDYPLVGYNNNWVVVTGNDYLGSGGTQVNVWVLNRASLYNGTLPTVKEFSIANYISITPTQTYDTTISEDYLVQDDDGNPGDGNGYLQIGAVSGTLNNPAVSVGTTLGVAYPWSDNSSAGATQLGSTQTIESGLDTKIENSVYRNGSIWLTHTVYLPAANPAYSAADWWQIDPSPLSVVQFGRISDPNGVIDYYYPSISVDAKNDVLLGYCTSSPNIYASSEYSYRTFTDPANTMETGYLFQQGQGIYTLLGDNRNRYGDFTFTTTDPVDSSFWTFQEFAAAPSSTWGTVIANVGAEPCNDMPSAGSISTSVDTVCSGNGTILNLTGYTSNVTGIHLLWQQSSNGINGWVTAIGGTGDTTASYSTAPLTNITYFRCIVSCLNSGLSDITAPIEVVLPGVYSVSNDTFCLPGTYNITANAIGSVNWYNSSTATSPFYIGNTLSATFSKDTTLYINTSPLTKNYSVGIIDDNYGQGGYFNYSFDDGLLFNAISDFTLDSVFIYASSTGTVAVNLLNADNGATISTATITVTGNEVNNKTAIPTNFNCVAGTNYNFTASNSTVSELFRTSAAADYSYTIPGIVSITAPNNTATGHYYFFYDWRISTTCTSQRIPVNVDIGNLVLTAKASPDTLCEGKDDSVLLTVSGASTYQWTTLNNITDSSLFVKPPTTTTYTVTGSNSSGCTGITHVTVNVKNCTSDVNPITVNTPSIEVYPNPTAGQFNLIINNLPNNAYTISLYNILGQKLMYKQVDVNSSKYTILLDASMFPADVYFIRVVSDNQQWTQRIIKQ